MLSLGMGFFMTIHLRLEGVGATNFGERWFRRWNDCFELGYQFARLRESLVFLRIP